MTLAPVEVLWQALDRDGFRPHGRSTDFYAQCPFHDGDNSDSLQVTEGEDGRALIVCHRQRCTAGQITGALGLALRDLFPRRNDGQPVSMPVRESRPVAKVMDVLELLRKFDRLDSKPSSLDLRWRLELHLAECPHCGCPNPSLTFDRLSRKVFAHCMLDCRVEDIVAGLERIVGADTA